MPSAAVEAAFQARLLQYTHDDPPFISSIVSAQPSSDQDTFLEVHYPVVNGIRRIINARHYCEEGAALLILNVRRNVELADALAVADNLVNIFRHVKFNSVETFAPDAPVINNNNNDGNWYSLSVIVPYRYQTTYPLPELLDTLMSVSPGSFIIAGTDAGLEYGYELVAGGGTYAVSGAAALLLRASDLVLAADATSYAVTGTAATFHVGRNLTAVAGNYAVSGTPADLGASDENDGFPNADNTGVQDGVTLTPVSGDQEINSSGVFENKAVTGGSIVVNANNVTVRNCSVTFSGGTAKIYVATGKTGVVIEYCDVDGTASNAGAKGIWVDEATGVEIRFCDIRRIEDGIYAFGNDTYIHDNYIHEPANINLDPHHDCIQFAGTGVVIEHNSLIAGNDQNSCIQFAGTPGWPIEVSITNNLMRAYTTAPLALMNMNDSLSEDTAVSVTDNHFTPGTFTASPYFLFNAQPPDIWEDNVNADTLAAIPPQAIMPAGFGTQAYLQIGVTQSANTGTVSSTINVPADAELVLVAMSGYGRADTANYHSGGTVTFTKGGTDTAMTSCGGGGDASTATWQASMWYMVSPDTGSNKTLKWDWAGSAISDDIQKNWSITFWKGIDTGDPVRDSDGAQAGSAPVSTPTLTAGVNTRIVAFAAMYNGAGDGAATVDSWSNMIEYAEIPHHSTSEGAWATYMPTGNTTVGVTTTSNATNVAIMAVVLNPA